MKQYGFIDIMTIIPEVKVSNIECNRHEIEKSIHQNKDHSILIFPELALTGTSCGDIFFQKTFQQTVMKQFQILLENTKNNTSIIIIGLPLIMENQLYNVMAVLQEGQILGMVPSTTTNRWFTSGKTLTTPTFSLLNQTFPVASDLVFVDKEDNTLSFQILFQEDIPNKMLPNKASITIIMDNQFALVTRKDTIKNQLQALSKLYHSNIVYISSSSSESTTNGVYSGYSCIVENGHILTEQNPFSLQTTILCTEIDFKNYQGIIGEKKVMITVQQQNNSLTRTFSKTPFVPSIDQIQAFCSEVINIQATALARRLKHLNIEKCILGISGGLDSTLAFLIIIEAYKKLQIDNKNLIAVTMPGFGTTDRTYQNAIDLVNSYHATLQEISIKDACLQHFQDIHHDYQNHDITYENAQARERTQILMDLANQQQGIVIGTGDLSELALGWCTYNGDHMSMYSVNADVPKTLVRQLVSYIASKSTDEQQKILNDIIDTPISPELLPPNQQGKITQKTENSVGPYILHDFYLYHFWGKKRDIKTVLFLASHTFQEYSLEELKHWFTFFRKRFFTQQFKRNCAVDGPIIGTVSLSPHGDCILPSDSDIMIWME